jgi:CheY-like chemotaxis protein
MKKLNLLVLDDDPVRHDLWEGWFTSAGHTYHKATTIEEFHNAIHSDVRFDIVFLDHDLNDHPHLQESIKVEGGRRIRLTGQDAARMLVKMNRSKLPHKVVIHSWNDHGADMMRYHLSETMVPVIKKTFPYKKYLFHSRKLKTEKPHLFDGRYADFVEAWANGVYN